MAITTINSSNGKPYIDIDASTNKVVAAYAINGTRTAAKYLYDNSGNAVLDSKTNQPYIVPLDYNPNKAIDLGKQHAEALDSSLSNASTDGMVYAAIANELAMFGLKFRSGAEYDIQTNYNGTSGLFVPAFTPIASYDYGLASAAFGLSATEALQAGGSYNLASAVYKQLSNLIPGLLGRPTDKIQDTSGIYNNNPNNPPNIIAGQQAYKNNVWSNAPSNTTNKAHCFPASALITMPDGSQKTIDKIAAGDFVATFNSYDDFGRGAIIAGEVKRLFTNITQEFYVLKNAAANGVVFNSTVTGGHLYLGTDGLFAKIEDIVQRDCCIVLSDGMVIRVAFERVVYSAATAHLYPQAERMVHATQGGLALAPKMERGWATYNFEVATHHVYIADNARVHNESVLDLVPNDAMPYNGDGTLNPNASVLVTGYEADGVTPKSAVYTDHTGQIHFLDTAHTANGVVLLNEKIVYTSNDGTIEHSYVAYDINRDANTGKKVSASGTDASGNSFAESFDLGGFLTGYVFKKADGSQMSLTGDAIGGVLGSSIGNAIGGKNFATKVVASTLIGSLGQTLGGIISRPEVDANGVRTGGTDSLIARFSDGTTPLDQAFSETLTHFGNAVPVNLLNNITGGVSGLLVGELANALGLKGFAAGAFTTVGTTITTQKPANDNHFNALKVCG
jgi:hypothetical protein